MKAAVVGLGKIGLPLAVQIAGSGIGVIGADSNPDVVAGIETGQALFPGETDLDERLRSVIGAGTFSATTSTPEAVAQVDFVIVVVPLVVDRSGAPDFAGIDSATEQIGGALRPGHTVIYETTLPIGTTRNRFGPILEQMSGLTMGEDFCLAFSPERVASGTVFRDLRSYPKVVGGIDSPSEKAAAMFYETALEFDERRDLERPNGVWAMGSTEAAEFVKLAETTYRDVNIALANEFAANAEARHLSTREIVAAANSQPYSHIHQPGIAVGGHCIPVYPRLYLAGHVEASLPSAARQVNDAQPARAIARLEEAIGSLEGRRVAVLGAAYRGGVKEMAFSGVFALRSEIVSRGGVCLVHDPLFAGDELEEVGLAPFALGEPVDAVVIQADHPEYADLLPIDVPGCIAVVDGRGIISVDSWTNSGAMILAVGETPR